MSWNICYLPSVEVWLGILSKRQLKSVAKELKLLEICGNKLRLPHSKALGAGLFELRERQFGLRIYYAFRQGVVIVLLHGGVKDTQRKDIQAARNLLRQYPQNEDNHESKKL